MIRQPQDRLHPQKHSPAQLRQNKRGSRTAIPRFWTALQGAIFQPQGEDIAATHRILALKWAIQYPGVRIPSLHQVYYYLKRRYPERMKLLARKGENYYDQNIRASVMRDPNTIRPNEGWVTDTQDCDFMIPGRRFGRH